ncbi:BURP domain-containing protein 13-like [Phragmites australis]|uniref:BURP domain-containing protein 13-like n=1 Tax=Phragmites australis TaxID=29695 RepID=UPI002D7796BA|nr:BURP domain-containing protein 13-like [Phragmites australis]
MPKVIAELIQKGIENPNHIGDQMTRYNNILFSRLEYGNSPSWQATWRECLVMPGHMAVAVKWGDRADHVWAAASALPRQECVVSAVSPLDGDRHVACHDEPYPYAVFQCHMTGRSSTKAYMITLSGRSPAVTMAALCHRDTSNWNPAHPAFEMLCHFMPYANLVFGEKTGFPY